MIPALFTRNIDGSEVLDRSFDELGGGLLLADIALDQQQARARQSWARESTID